MLNLIKQELSSRSAFVENIINHLLIVQDPIFFTLCVSKNWVSKLIKCCTELQSQYSRHYNHDQVKYEDITVICN